MDTAVVRLAHSAFKSISLHCLESARGFAFLHILANICCLCLSDYSHLNRCEMISHCGLAGISLVINLHSHVQISIIHNSKDVETWKQPRYQWESESLCQVQLFVTHGLYSPWTSPGQNTGVGSLSVLQGIFPTQGLNPVLPHCRWILYQLSQKEAQEYWSG